MSLSDSALRELMKISLLSLAISLALIACSAPSPATTSDASSAATRQTASSPEPGNLQTYAYETEVTLRGTLISASGETPDGEKVVYQAIQLNAPISVEASSDPEDFNETEKGVMLLQLALDESTRAAFKSLEGSSAKVVGVLFHSHNGHHQTDVLIQTTSINPISSQ